jgi:hypothetical protein
MILWSKMIHTDRSLSSVVTPRRVTLNGFLAKGARRSNGSKKYPTERAKGHSCVTEPPLMIPGLRRTEVPVQSLTEGKRDILYLEFYQYKIFQ